MQYLEISILLKTFEGTEHQSSSEQFFHWKQIPTALFCSIFILSSVLSMDLVLPETLSYAPLFWITEYPVLQKDDYRNVYINLQKFYF